MGRDTHFNVNDKLIIHNVHKFFKDNRNALNLNRLKSLNKANVPMNDRHPPDSRSLTSYATGVGEATVGRIVLEASRTKGQFDEKSNLADTRGRASLIPDDDTLIGLIREEILTRTARNERATVASIIVWLRDRFQFGLSPRSLYSYLKDWGFCTTRESHTNALQERYSVKGPRGRYLRFRRAGHTPYTGDVPLPGGADVHLVETRYPVTGPGPSGAKGQQYINILGAVLVEPPTGAEANGPSAYSRCKIGWVPGTVKVWVSELSTRKRQQTPPSRPGSCGDSPPLVAYTGGSVHYSPSRFHRWFKKVCKAVQQRGFARPVHMVLTAEMCKHLEGAPPKPPAPTAQTEELINWLTTNGTITCDLHAADQPTRDEMWEDVLDKRRAANTAIEIAGQFGIECAIIPRLHPELDIGRHLFAIARCISPWHHAVPIATGVAETVRDGTERALTSSHMKNEQVFVRALRRVLDVEAIYFQNAQRVTTADGVLVRDEGEPRITEPVGDDGDVSDDEDGHRDKRRRT